jgi:transposase
MMLFVGDDWAEAHHDVHLMTETGEKLAARQLPEGLGGIAQLHAMIAEHVDEPGQVIIGIETDRGPWVQALLAAGYLVYAINPLMVARYRERHNVAGAKSDAGDAKAFGRSGPYRPAQPSPDRRRHPRCRHGESAGTRPSEPHLGKDPTHQPAP